MMTIQEEWKEILDARLWLERGGTPVSPSVVELVVNAAACHRQPATRPPNKGALEVLREASAAVTALTAKLDARAEGEIKADLAGTGAVAIRNPHTGATAVLLPPRPYWLRNEGELSQLKSEAAELRVIVDNPNALWVERERASVRLHELERQIAVAMGETLPWMRRSVHGPAGFPDA